MNSRSILTTATTALFLAAAPALHAGTILSFQEKVPGSQAAGSQAGTVPVRLMTVDGPRLRIESTGTAGGNRVLIFQAGTGTLWVIDPASRSYTEIHRSEVPFGTEEVKAGAPGAPTGTPPPAKAGGVTYKKVDSGFIVNGFRTDKYEGTKNGTKVEELYVADPKSLGIEAADFNALQGMARALAEQGQNVLHLSLGAELPGMPVRTLYFSGGKPTLQVDLAGVRKEDVPATAFELPAGFTRKAQGLAGQ